MDFVLVVQLHALPPCRLTWIGDDTWVVIPVDLWLPSWLEQYPPSTKLAVRLNKSLYGHPESGQRRQKPLEDRLQALGGTESTEYPSTWLFTRGGLVLNVYVDDLTLSGPTELHAAFWVQLRKSAKLEGKEVVGFLADTTVLLEISFLQIVIWT